MVLKIQQVSISFQIIQGRAVLVGKRGLIKGKQNIFLLKKPSAYPQEPRNLDPLELILPRAHQKSRQLCMGGPHSSPILFLLSCPQWRLKQILALDLQGIQGLPDNSKDPRKHQKNWKVMSIHIVGLNFSHINANKVKKLIELALCCFCLSDCWFTIAFDFMKYLWEWKIGSRLNNYNLWTMQLVVLTIIGSLSMV